MFTLFISNHFFYKLYINTFSQYRHVRIINYLILAVIVIVRPALLLDMHDVTIGGCIEHVWASSQLNGVSTVFLNSNVPARANRFIVEL